MLPKINRLTKKKDFDLVFKKGNSVKGDFLLFKALGNKLKENRFGFIVSNKVSKRATVRNKIKRRMRQAAYKELPKNSNHRDVVIIALPGSEKREFLEIQEVISKFFKRNLL
jgi:ribonuclease P protein component